jgi:hypothetical protein
LAPRCDGALATTGFYDPVADMDVEHHRRSFRIVLGEGSRDLPAFVAVWPLGSKAVAILANSGRPKNVRASSLPMGRSRWNSAPETAIVQRDDQEPYALAG